MSATRRTRTPERKLAYGTKRWKRARAIKLATSPQCECDDCQKLPAAQRPIAVVVHHIDGLGPNGPRGYDQANLQSLTKAHHDRITAIRAPRKRPEEPHPGEID